ncbi:response regulator transcription factor [Eubacteriales bacterium OttesenSCG-928-A19]|nr:response regulator transcription factor [Eubacteriales bacterium OttesenSCG-928-A19]
MSQPKTVLLVEDNEKIMAANMRALKDAGYCLEVAYTLAEARACLARGETDVIVLDIKLPDGNGLDFIGEIRQTIAAPVLLLTAMNEKDDMLAGLRAGGDDYITKPYDLDELRERVAAFIRRKEIYEARVPQRLVQGPLTLDLIVQKAFLDGKDMLLTPKDYAILCLLTQSAGNAISPEKIYQNVWGQPMGANSHAVKSAIWRLRKKLAGSGHTVHSVRGEGYFFGKE